MDNGSVMCSGNTNMELYKFTKTGPFSMQFSLCHTLHYFLPVSVYQANTSCFLYRQPSFLFPEQSSILPVSCKVDLCTVFWTVHPTCLPVHCTLGLPVHCTLRLLVRCTLRLPVQCTLRPILPISLKVYPGFPVS